MSLSGMRTGQGTGPTSSGVADRAPADFATSNGSAGAIIDRGGRPSKYEAAFCEQVIGHCQQGYSLKSFAASIGVTRRTLGNWVEEHADFAEAFEIAKGWALYRWEQRAEKIGDGEGGPGAAALVQFMLKNFGAEDYSDKREVAYTGAIQHNLTYEQAIEEARRRGLPERVLIADNRE